jgi:heptosyltransferase-2
LYEYLHLAAALGADSAPVPPRVAVSPDEVRTVAAKFGLENGSSPGRPIFGLNPGAEYGPAKRWPADRFIAAAQQIQARTNCTWVILGGPADMPTGEAIHSALLGASQRSGSAGTPHSALQNLAGRTSLRELMALLKLCRVLLTNDSGPMHVAAALGTPVVVPFGSTSPELTGPGLPGDPRHQLLQSGVPCAPCFWRTCPIDFRCMNRISVEQVVEAVLRLL